MLAIMRAEDLRVTPGRALLTYGLEAECAFQHAQRVGCLIALRTDGHFSTEYIKPPVVE